MKKMIRACLSLWETGDLGVLGCREEVCEMFDCVKMETGCRGGGDGHVAGECGMCRVRRKLKD